MKSEDKAGLYLTIIVHLVVLIVLLAAGLDVSIRGENSFVLDFTKQEELERLQEEAEKLEKELALKQSISEKIKAELGSVPVRNVAVNREDLKDDRGTDAKKLYEDAARLQKELNSGFSAPENDVADPNPSRTEKEEVTKAAYSGPSVISYYLEGRKASKLPIPAYRCYGSGEVKVLISVNNAGTVTAARVDDSCSSADACLRSFAIRAARLSKFSASPSAPANQQGNIVYSFVAQ